MTAAHTPGPWKVGNPTGFVNQIGIEPAIGCAYGAGDEVLANARLIAVAPDLLQVLRELHRVCLDMDLEIQTDRPTEAEYQAAMAAAASVLAGIRETT